MSTNPDMDALKARRHPVLAWMFAFSLCLALAACDSAEERAQDHYERGLTLLEAGEPARAGLEFRNAIKLDPALIDARFEYAKLLLAESRMRDAARAFQEIVGRAPEHLEARLRLGEILLAVGAIDTALPHVRAAAKLAPKDARALALEAAAEYRLGNVEAALALADRALKIDPGDSTARLTRTVERLAAGAPEEALAEIDQGLASAPDDPALNLVRLGVLQRMDDAEAIDAQLRRMIALFPDRSAFHRSLAQRRLQAGDRLEAETVLRARADSNPADTSAALDVARFLDQVDGPDAARAELVRLIETAPGPAPYRIALARLEFRGGAAEAAINRLRTLIGELEASAVSVGARTTLAAMLLTRSDEGADAAVDDAEAETLLDAALAVDGGNVAALTLRAQLRIAQDRPDDAIRDLREALAERPDSPNILLMLAEANRRAGNRDLAGERLALAVRASGGAPGAVLRYARHLLEEDEAELAETVVIEALERRRDDPALLNALGRIRLARKDWAGARRAADTLSGLVEEGANGGAAMSLLAAAWAGEERHEESLGLLEENWARVSGADANAAGAALAALVQGYLRAGEMEKAEVFLTEILAENPTNIRALVLLGVIRNRSGRAEAALESYRAAVTAHPDRAEAHVALVRQLAAMGRIEAAAETARAALETHPEHALLRLTLAMTLDQAGERAAAISEYETLFAAAPQSEVVANNLASLLTAGEPEPEVVERAYRVARRLRGSETPQFRETFGWILFLRGDHAGALRELRPAADALPDNALTQLHLGLAYEKTGETALARAQIETALMLAGDGPFPERSLAEAALARLPSADPSQ